MLLCKIAHEQLLDLQTSGIPPSQTNQESVSSGAASETGCLSVQKKPLLGIFQRRARATRNHFVALLAKKLQTGRMRSNKFRRRKPVLHGKMFTKTVGGDSGTKESRHSVFFARFSECRSTYCRMARRVSCRQAREFLIEC